MKGNYVLKYNSCKHTPCGKALSTHNNCKPSYCYPSESKNWSFCNMKNWYASGTRKHFIYKSKCKTGKNIKKSKKKSIDKLQVDALTLHNKMPYIWRFMTPKTQKKMIILAKLPVNLINTWPSYNRKYKTKKNKNKNLKKSTIRYKKKTDKILKLLKNI